MLMKTPRNFAVSHVGSKVTSTGATQMSCASSRTDSTPGGMDHRCPRCSGFLAETMVCDNAIWIRVDRCVNCGHYDLKPDTRRPEGKKQGWRRR